MDIKLGTTLYDASDASLSEEKIRKMQEKMKVRSSVKTGAAITGFQVRPRGSLPQNSGVDLY